jgi:pyruvate/2-oxoglutarate dehydrogenase complex dihydrolipoamide acyltransferase (E2) component
MSEDQGQSTKRPATERAEELLSRAGWTAGLFASMIGMRVARVAAYAREEAEDLWAEAQSKRRQSGGDLGAAVSRVADTARAKAEETKESLKQGAASGEEAGSGAATAGASPEAEERRPEPEQSAELNGEVESIKATDAARRRAQELDVDLREVEGTGSGGQITVQDVKKKAKGKS